MDTATNVRPSPIPISDLSSPTSLGSGVELTTGLRELKFAIDAIAGRSYARGVAMTNLQNGAAIGRICHMEA